MCQMMKQQGILSDNIVIPTDLSVSPMDGDFGQAYKGQTLQKEYTLNGYTLAEVKGVAPKSLIETSKFFD